jgi:hypothetical protein
MFVSSLESNKEAVALLDNSSICSLPSLLTLALSCPSLPLRDSLLIIYTLPNCYTSSSKDLPQSTSSSLHVLSQGSDLSSTSFYGNTTISKGSLLKLSISSKCSVSASSGRYAITYKKTLHMPAVSS